MRSDPGDTEVMITTFAEYQEKALAIAEYKQRHQPLIGMVYTALGVAEEAGEVAGKIKKMLRDNGGVITEEIAQKIRREMGDNLWYLAALSDELDFAGFPTSLVSVANIGIEKIYDRAARGVLGGSGDDR